MQNSITKRLIIIDFGFAHKYGMYACYSRATKYAPNDILSGIFGMYKPIFMHDLESLVKMIFINSFYSHYTPILSKINHSFESLLKFWEHIEKSFAEKGDITMKNIFEMVKLRIEKEKYEQHCDEVKNLFKQTSLCFPNLKNVV